jgi:hypothetical protein
VNVRTGPSLEDTILGTQVIDSLGVIVGGPSTIDSHNWWQVNFDNGVDGWTAEDFLVKVVTPASTPSPIPTPTPPAPAPTPVLPPASSPISAPTPSSGGSGGGSATPPPPPSPAPVSIPLSGGGVSSVTPSLAPTPTSSPRLTPKPVSVLPTVVFQPLTKNLRFGSQSSQVTLLQRMLAQNPLIYPEKKITGYYGSLTTKAVQNFQRKYGIVSSGTPSSTGFGTVGPKTRAKLNELYRTAP